MLVIASSLRELNFRALMEVYIEGNRENAGENYPDLPPEQGLLRAEQDFYDYLREDFFRQAGAIYAIWASDGRYVSALRLEPYRDGLLLEALETAPDARQRGYATALMEAVLERLPGKRIYSHVRKRNLPSRKTHEKCGFREMLDYAVYLDGSVDRHSLTLCREG